ncbi:MAG: hypothetical protein JJE13_08915 [Thermoleophilia bacterium]|nr:hypothetical protein [Thermoleophilia bacterium]
MAVRFVGFVATLALILAFGTPVAQSSIPKLETSSGGWEYQEEEHLPYYFGEAPTDLEREISQLKIKALELWPNTYAGFWKIDGDPSRGIFAAFTADAQEKVDRLAEGFSKPELLRPVTHRYSNVELGSLLDEVVDKRDLARDGKLDLPGVDRNRMDVRVDEVNNRVDVIAPHPTEGTVSYFAESFPQYSRDTLRVVEGPIMEPEACINRTQCGYVLRSGLETVNNYNGCSTAFAVTKTDADVPSQLLSAAHCGNPSGSSVGDPVYHGSNPYTTGDRYGWVRGETQLGVLDVERHSVQNGFYTIPRIYGNLTNQQMPVYYVASYAGTMQGDPDCKAGVTTGLTCGTVTSVNFAPSYVANSANFISTNTCSDPGDSGAGHFWGTMALGVHSGGAGTGCGAFFSHIQYAEIFMGLTVNKLPIP